jgi:hypothetical protein
VGLELVVSLVVLELVLVELVLAELELELELVFPVVYQIVELELVVALVVPRQQIVGLELVVSLVVLELVVVELALAELELELALVFPVVDQNCQSTNLSKNQTQLFTLLESKVWRDETHLRRLSRQQTPPNPRALVGEGSNIGPPFQISLWSFVSPLRPPTFHDT